MAVRAEDEEDVFEEDHEEDERVSGMGAMLLDRRRLTFGVLLVLGFFVGMAANLIPSPAGGVGSVDAGMIGAFVLFGIPAGIVFPAVLTYRVIAFWLPIPPGIVAFFQLRRTVARWDSERQGYTSESKVTAEAT